MTSWGSHASKSRRLGSFLLPAASVHSEILRLSAVSSIWDAAMSGVLDDRASRWRPSPEQDSPSDAANPSSSIWKIEQYLLLDEGLRICPLCLTDFGYHSLLFQLRGAYRCPIHHRPLVSTCPDCDRPIGSIWNDDALCRFQLHGPCRPWGWRANADHVGERHALEQMAGLMEAILARVADARQQIAMLAPFGCTLSYRGDASIIAFLEQNGVLTDFDWINATTGLSASHYQITKRLPAARASQALGTYSPVDDWRISGKTLTTKGWTGLQCPVRELSFFPGLLDEILDRLGPHRECLDSLRWGGAQCAVAAAFAIWWTLWGDVRRGHSESLGLVSPRQNSSCPEPIAVASFHRGTLLVQAPWPPERAPLEHMICDTRDRQTVAACVLGSFDQILNFVRSIGAGKVPSPFTCLALMHNSETIYQPTCREPPCAGHTASSAKVVISQAIWLLPASEPVLWRFKSVNTIRCIDFLEHRLPELVHR